MLKLKETLALRIFGLLKVPAILFTSPTVESLTNKECEIKIPLNYRTKNHMNCMYFGVLSVGADCAGGLIAMNAIKESGQDVDILFKDFKAQFLKRAEADVHFSCSDGDKIQRQLKEVIRTGKRVNKPITVVATTPKVSGDEPVALFELTLSLKSREDKKAKAKTATRIKSKKPTRKVKRKVRKKAS
jgi:hypothetical protein